MGLSAHSPEPRVGAHGPEPTALSPVWAHTALSPVWVQPLPIRNPGLKCRVQRICPRLPVSQRHYTQHVGKEEKVRLDFINQILLLFSWKCAWALLVMNPSAPICLASWRQRRWFKIYAQISAREHWLPVTFSLKGRTPGLWARCT